LYWLLKHLKVRYVKDEYENQFTSAPQYASHPPFPTPLDLLKCSAR
jgi:hypothetical protein